MKENIYTATENDLDRPNGIVPAERWWWTRPHNGNAKQKQMKKRPTKRTRRPLPILAAVA